MQEPSRNEIWKMFNRIAPTYDRLNRILSLGMDLHWRKRVASYLPNKKDLHILDLATGTADQLIALFESSASIQRAVGIDLAEEMLRLGKEKIAEKSYGSKIEFFTADAQHLPFQSMCFDAATFSFGIRNVSMPLASLKEIYRILKPKGVSLILEFALPSFPLKGVYLFYLRHILPRIGALFSKNKSAYRYLNETIETFPQGNSFCSLLKQAGFSDIAMHKMGMGAVALYVGKK
jgi:demethylmenaquinone methyltransferase/2-methoxy-6-polyprenyl-1,4-benzoquinol methylase